MRQLAHTSVAMNETAELSIDQIIGGLEIKGTDFAKSLIAGFKKYGSFTSKQLFWARKLAIEATSPQPVAKLIGTGLSVIADKFRTAKSKGLKHPALLFFGIGGAEKTRLSLAPDNGKNPGCLYIKADGRYAGKIAPDGRYFPMRDASAELGDFLAAFAADPVGVGAANGKAAGRCCYCGLQLTDVRSLTAGYGATCASHWGLPWGDKSAPKLSMAPEDRAVELAISESMAAAA